MSALIAGVVWLFAAPASAQCVRAPELTVAPSADASAGPTLNDRLGRMVAPVMVNGQGPFRFVVDTGANRSVLSQGLADRLGLTPFGQGEVHTVHGETTAPLVRIESLSYGQVILPAEPMPVLSGPVFAGEQGLLGVDGMRGRRLRLDFDRSCIEIRPASRSRFAGEGWTRLRGELRFGHLVVIPGRIGTVNLNVLVDTGSDRSLANVALRDALRQANPHWARDVEGAVRAYSAGHAVLLDEAMALPRLQLQDMQIRNLVTFVGDFHIFTLWGMQNEPTMLIGMDVISRAREIVIDYDRATVDFRVRQTSRTGSNITRAQTRGSSTYE
ncbi:MAG: aspartyl protease family protein [Hyphomonadaceae bacterium]|nr:aspartyl protease family protein [Hyphomonadaceae bacterium]